MPKNKNAEILLEKYKARIQLLERKLAVEVSLDRVRHRTINMHKSEELVEVATVMFGEFQKLGFADVVSCGFVLIDEINETQEVWSAQTSSRLLQHITLPLFGDNILKKRYDAWKRQDPIIIQILEPHQLKKHLEVVMPDAKTSKRERQAKEDMPEKTHFYMPSFSKGYLLIISSDQLKEEFKDILVCFAKVFEQMYIRFLDLQKAEAQTREAQIEVALERLRAQTMAMHHSDDLREVVAVVYDQLVQLGFDSWGCMIMTKDQENKGYEWWLSNINQSLLPEAYFVEHVDHPIYHKALKNADDNEPYFVVEISGEEKKTYDHLLLTKTSLKKLPPVVKNAMMKEKTAFGSTALYKYGILQAHGPEPLPDDKAMILQRFAKVFEQSYTRFLDLQKAESQAREAQIETALERVRTTAMAMHHTRDIQNVIDTVCRQLYHLGLRIDTATISIKEENKHDLNFWGSTTSEQKVYDAQKGHVPFIDLPIHTRLIEAIKKDEEFFADEYSKEEKNDYLKHSFKQDYLKSITGKWKQKIFDAPGLARSIALSENTIIGISNFKKVPYTEHENDILKRFARVFDQSYTRFLDIQKAEGQAREAQIEVALERVRAGGMAMHHTSDMQQVIDLITSQLLDIGINANSAALADKSEQSKDLIFWGSTDGQNVEYSTKLKVPYYDNPIINTLVSAFQNEQTFTSAVFTKQEKDDFFEYLFHLPQWSHFTSERKALVFAAPAYAISVALTEHIGIGIIRYNDQLFSEVDNAILKRFAQVFEQTYIRFLDLQKAEAQVREAQIETALERVRSRTMAMHKSEELGPAVDTLLKQFKVLGFQAISSWVSLMNPDENTIEFWTKHDEQLIPGLTVHTSQLENFEKEMEAWKQGQEYIQISMPIELAREALKKIFNIEIEEAENESTFHLLQVWHRHGLMGLGTWSKADEHTLQVMKRFANVFEQTYTRFLDLQKAETQVREAQIEAALEKVRSRSLAMRKSDELGEVAMLLYSELIALGFTQFFNCGFIIVDEIKKVQNGWMTQPEGTFIEELNLPYPGDAVTKKRLNAWKEKIPVFYQKVEGESLEKHLRYVTDQSHSANQTNNIIPFMPDPCHFYCGNFNEGYLHIVSNDKLEQEAEAILSRFTKVFSQTYTRFLDLEKAEHRTREAEIEAAMERVRSRAMAMHKTGQLENVIKVIFDELKNIGFEPSLCSIGIYDKETKGADWWSYIANHDLPGSYHFPYLDSRWFREIYDAWIEQKPHHYIELFGEEMEEQERLSFEQTEWKMLPDEIKNTIYESTKDGMKASYVSMTHGMLEIVTGSTLNEDQIKLLQRFTKVIDLTYTRVEDLRKAEARAKEAERQASLDRIRAEIASMRNADDLMGITPLIWKELTVLKIPFFRCGVFIMNEKEKLVSAFLGNSTKDTISSLTLPFDSAETITNLVLQWRAQKVYAHTWDQDALIAFFASMTKQGHITDSDLVDDPPDRLHLQFFPFKQGMLYIGSLNPLDKDLQEMIQRMARTVEVAYLRYEDFIKVENAKATAESALVELKSAQTQLIHSEKMASLGELTAGIAHEIQNPLNFVNNFSQVSGELLDELKEELSEGNMEDVVEIANDVKINLEKIHHHGERASSIVKGMLSHSRSNTGEKEFTDINVLCDEYLRLSFHGLRAKDRNFNSGFETYFDDSIPNIKIVPQEIGRVILNILNNGFYAVDQRRIKEGSNYKPMISICTRQLENNYVEIVIKDNGGGIPSEIVQKIFQPFFTTKPTGSGTGLGLSLSYDIVTKGHGGELTVKAKEGEGTKFRILLPIE